MLWEIDIYPTTGTNRLAETARAAAADLGLGTALQVEAGWGYLLQGKLDERQVHQLARRLLADDVVERTVIAPAGDPALSKPAGDPSATLIHVLPKPGVMDPVALSARQAIAELGVAVNEVRTLQKFWLSELPEDQLEWLCAKALSNEAIEQVVVGPLHLQRLELGSPYEFQLVTVPLREMADDQLGRLSREQQLYLSIEEMRTIQAHFRGLDRDPTDAELETLAQTWSEHCSHKTLRGRVEYRDENGVRRFQNLLKETIFAATEEIRRKLGDDDWCVSVFEDNAGIVRFDEQDNVVFKVETHNHPSALEPYGGANTGIGGVIRDPLGTGLGAKPVASTDVFCFAAPDTPADEIPAGVLHPKRVMKGVVAGVRDYGNRMGIPTVNGAIYFDPRYLGNPLVYCGNVGILPRGKTEKGARAGDLIVAIGGRTGRDGIHGATFSSTELTAHSETTSGGAVQIGNAITEKMVVDVVLAARDLGLYSAITDCGAGGFSSAVGEMAEKIGAEVQLEAAPLKYEGLSYTEIWISEAQERMVLAVPPQNWDAFSRLCASEGVEATVIGKFVPSGRLKLKYREETVADLSMEFLHDGRPPVVREAAYSPPAAKPFAWPDDLGQDFTGDLLAMLGSLNVASKEWVIRQYDHEVQGGSVVKPLVGVHHDGPGDAAVIQPKLGSSRGLVISCGMNPYYGDLDPYHMAAAAIDEAVRNCVAVGADPNRIAILDNFCWGNTDRPAVLGELVRAAVACRDTAVALGTPFISGKDSLNNEFHFEATPGEKRTITIPPTLLISALGQIPDVRRAVTMDLKEPGNALYLVGLTRDELGGSHFALVHSLSGGRVPKLNAGQARTTFAALHQAISAGLVRACHDLSEGGLAVAAAEMAFAGGWGAAIHLPDAPRDFEDLPDDSSPRTHAALLFSESNSRFLCEVRPDAEPEFRKVIKHAPNAKIGETNNSSRLEFTVTTSGENDTGKVVDASLNGLKEAWQSPLRWD